jgi:hypothetical protein
VDLSPAAAAESAYILSADTQAGYDARPLLYLFKPPEFSNALNGV